MQVSLFSSLLTLLNQQEAILLISSLASWCAHYHTPSIHIHCGVLITTTFFRSSTTMSCYLPFPHTLTSETHIRTRTHARIRAHEAVNTPCYRKDVHYFIGLYHRAHIQPRFFSQARRQSGVPGSHYGRCLYYSGPSNRRRGVCYVAESAGMRPGVGSSRWVGVCTCVSNLCVFVV